MRGHPHVELTPVAPNQVTARRNLERPETGQAMKTPFWGPQTSYLNFCEEDYVITRYIAEFINSLSSLAFAAYGAYGLFHPPQFPTRARLVSYCGLIGVGVCSAGYHMTMKYHTQMSDELSMHLLTTPLIYRLLTFKSGPQHARLVATVLLVLFATVMITHMVMDEFLLHATAFGLGIYVIASRILKTIPEQVPDPRLRKTVRNITILGCVCFGFGYIAWLIDDWACAQLIDARRAVGLPFAFLLELHGWWHVLTAIGGYIAVAVVDLITSSEVTKDPTHLFAWPVPVVARLLALSTGPMKQG